MFKAFIVACHIANPADCILISDDRGPYDTEEEYMDRMYYKRRQGWGKVLIKNN